MKAWYYLVKGRPHGPVTVGEIEHEIKAGHLLARDLIYRDRDTLWREVSSFGEFAHHFKNKPVATTTATDTAAANSEGKIAAPAGDSSQWVLLVRKADGSGYKQKGPFTTKDIVKLLHDQEIIQTDYVWREGLKEWYKILAVGEIQEALNNRVDQSVTSPTMTVMPPPPPMGSTTKSLSQKNEKDLAENDARVADAEEPTITDVVKVEDAVVATKDDHSGRKNREVKKGKKRPEKVEAKGARTSLMRYFIEMTPIGKTLFVAGALSLIVVGLYSSLWLGSYQDRFNSKLTPPEIAEIPPLPREKAAAPPQPPKSDAAPVMPAPKPELSAANAPAAAPVAHAPAAPTVAPFVPPPAEVEIKHAPTRIQIERIANGTENLSFKINSDASSHYSVMVTLESILGEVLDSPSVFVRKVIRTLPERTVELKRLKIPFGEYRLIVESENVKAATNLDFGTNTKDFKARLNSQRKKIAFDHNQERHSLIKVVSRFEFETFKLAQNIDSAAELRSWNEFYRSWRRTFERIQNPYLSEISVRNRQRFVHADLWVQLKEARTQVDRESKNVNRARSEKRPTSSAQIRALAQNMSQIKEQAVQASLWK